MTFFVGNTDSIIGRPCRNQAFRLFPTETRIGNRLAVYTVTDFLAAVFEIAFDHKAFYEVFDIGSMATTLKDVFGNAYLFEIPFSRIGMVGIDDDGRMGEVPFSVGFI